MRKKHNETAVQAAERYISECRQAAGLFPALCATFRRFDGKVFNKRFETALQAETGRIYAQKKSGSQNDYIDIYFYSDSGEHMTLLYAPLPADKRIIAADLIRAAEDKRNEYLKEADHMAQVIPVIDEKKRQIEYIKNLLENTLSDLTYTEKDLFGLNVHVRSY